LGRPQADGGGAGAGITESDFIFFRRSNWRRQQQRHERSYTANSEPVPSLLHVNSQIASAVDAVDKAAAFQLPDEAVIEE